MGSSTVKNKTQYIGFECLNVQVHWLLAGSRSGSFWCCWDNLTDGWAFVSVFSDAVMYEEPIYYPYTTTGFAETVAEHLDGPI